jgi:hypothetical protein
MDKILDKLERDADDILCSKEDGYWSNLDKSENDYLVKDLKYASSAKEALIKKYPQYYDMIFSPKREAGLELLELKGNEACIDYGCMWGALTIPLAKRTKSVLGVDQTLQSLIFLKKRIEDENLKNIDLLCDDLNNMSTADRKFDIAVVNGVLEWIPEKGDIELKQYYGKKVKKDYTFNPQKMQTDFLKKVYSNLNKNGKLYLAIENRYDFKMFLGLKDPHSNLMFTSFLPRKVANYISMKKLGRPYVNWLYSFSTLKNLLNDVGFSTVDLYCCFPDYHFPKFISPYDHKLEGFTSTIPLKNDKGKITLKRAGRVIAELLLFRYLKVKFMAPAIIAVAKKD